MAGFGKEALDETHGWRAALLEVQRLRAIEQAEQAARDFVGEEAAEQRTIGCRLDAVRLPARLFLQMAKRLNAKILVDSVETTPERERLIPKEYVTIFTAGGPVRVQPHLGKWIGKRVIRKGEHWPVEDTHGPEFQLRAIVADMQQRPHRTGAARTLDTILVGLSGWPSPRWAPPLAELRDGYEVTA